MNPVSSHKCKHTKRGDSYWKALKAGCPLWTHQGSLYQRSPYMYEGWWLSSCHLNKTKWAFNTAAPHRKLMYRDHISAGLHPSTHLSLAGRQDLKTAANQINCSSFFLSDYSQCCEYCWRSSWHKWLFLNTWNHAYGSVTEFYQLKPSLLMTVCNPYQRIEMGVKVQHAFTKGFSLVNVDTEQWSIWQLSALTRIDLIALVHFGSCPAQRQVWARLYC